MLTEWQFWSTIWAIAAASGIARTLRDSDYHDLLDVVSVGLFSGMVGLGVVAFWVGSSGGHIGNEPRYMGLSALLGLMGKEQDRLVRCIISKAFQVSGVDELPRKRRVLGDDTPVDRGDRADDSNHLEHSDDECFPGCPGR